MKTSVHNRQSHPKAIFSNSTVMYLQVWGVSEQSHSNIAADDLSSIMNVDIIGILPISKEKVQQLQLETQADKKLQELNKCIKEG